MAIFINHVRIRENTNIILNKTFRVPGRVAQSVNFVSPSAFSRRAVVSYWRKYVHEVLVNRLGGLSLPRKSVVRLTDRPRKTTIQQQRNV